MLKILLKDALFQVLELQNSLVNTRSCHEMDRIYFSLLAAFFIELLNYFALYNNSQNLPNNGIYITCIDVLVVLSKVLVFGFRIWFSSFSLNLENH